MAKTSSVEYWCLGSVPMEARHFGNLVGNIKVSEQVGASKSSIRCCKSNMLCSKAGVP